MQGDLERICLHLFVCVCVFVGAGEEVEEEGLAGTGVAAEEGYLTGEEVGGEVWEEGAGSICVCVCVWCVCMCVCVC